MESAELGNTCHSLRHWQAAAADKGFIQGGGIIGLLLDVDKGSLAVYVNGKRCGLAVPRGLLPPLQWAVDLFDGEKMTIDGPKPPPPVDPAELLEEERSVSNCHGSFSFKRRRFCQDSLRMTYSIAGDFGVLL